MTDTGVRLVRFQSAPSSRPPLTIVITCGTGPTALIGSERFGLHLARELAVQGNHVSLVIQTPGPLGANDLEGAFVALLPALDATTLVSHLQKPDIVVAIDVVWAPAARVALDASRAWHTPFAVVPASAQGAWLDPDASLAVCADADAVLAVTAAEGRALERRGIDASRIAIIGYGAYDQPPRVERPYSTSDAEPVLFLGRKHRDKGYRALLAAAPLVWERCPDVSFLFFGPRVDPDCLDWFARFNDPRIVERERPTSDEKAAALAGCAVLCLPTTNDVFPQAFLEAWQAARPVISGPFDGAHEVVRHGVDGVVVDTAPEPLADAVGQLLAAPDLRRAMGRAGQERVNGDLSWPAMTRRVSERLRALAAMA